MASSFYIYSASVKDKLPQFYFLIPAGPLIIKENDTKPDSTTVGAICHDDRQNKLFFQKWAKWSQLTVSICEITFMKYRTGGNDTFLSDTMYADFNMWLSLLNQSPKQPSVVATVIDTTTVAATSHSQSEMNGITIMDIAVTMVVVCIIQIRHLTCFRFRRVVQFSYGNTPRWCADWPGSLFLLSVFRYLL